jgi:hypothetical protein
VTLERLISVVFVVLTATLSLIVNTSVVVHCPSHVVRERRKLTLVLATVSALVA